MSATWTAAVCDLEALDVIRIRTEIQMAVPVDRRFEVAGDEGAIGEDVHHDWTI